MLRFLMEAGPMIWPILLLTQVIGLLVLWNLLRLLVLRRGSPARHRQTIDAVLFWGCVAAVLGFLGQWIGIHRLAGAVAERGFANPELIAYGLSESLLTPVAGMAVLVVAAFVWFALRLLESGLRPPPPASAPTE